MAMTSTAKSPWSSRRCGARRNRSSKTSDWTLHAVCTALLVFVSECLISPAVVFFKTRAPVDPAELVRVMCQDAANKETPRRSRLIKRLTPMTLMGKATEAGIKEVAQQVLAPHFHDGEAAPKRVSGSRLPAPLRLFSVG